MLRGLNVGSLHVAMMVQVPSKPLTSLGKREASRGTPVPLWPLNARAASFEKFCPTALAQRNSKKTLARLVLSAMFSLHFAKKAIMAAFGATDNCSPRWAQD